MRRFRPRNMGIAVLALCLLLLAGCGNQGSQFGTSVIITNGAGSGQAPAEDTGTEDAAGMENAAGTESAAPDTENAASPAQTENLFASMPESYMFCSGAGAWSTDLCLEPDGSFTGVFHDSDMGDADPARFPDGTVYICEFSGNFTRPERVGEYVYVTGLESLELAHPADESEEIAEGIRYIYSGPYGLENAAELLIYTPDAPAADLSEEELWALRGPYDWEETGEGTLGLWLIYNVTEDCGFVAYPLTEE